MDIKKQLLLFDAIQSNYENKRAFISSIKKLLPYQKSSLYKRLRGDTLLTIDEMVCLAKHYNLSLDAIFELKTNSFVFEFPDIILSSEEPYLNYLHQLQLLFSTTQQLCEIELQLQSNELPFFYYLKYPDLAFFKLFVFIMIVRVYACSNYHGRRIRYSIMAIIPFIIS